MDLLTIFTILGSKGFLSGEGEEGGHSASNFTPHPLWLPVPLLHLPPLLQEKFRTVRTNIAFQALRIDIILGQIVSPIEHNGI